MKPCFLIKKNNSNKSFVFKNKEKALSLKDTLNQVAKSLPKNQFSIQIKVDNIQVKVWKDDIFYLEESKIID